MTTLDLNVRFRNETGMSCINSKGEPEAEYVKWLERIIIIYNDIEDKNRKAQTAKDYAEGAVFGYQEGFKSAISALQSALPSVDKMAPPIPPTTIGA